MPKDNESGLSFWENVLGTVIFLAIVFVLFVLPQIAYDYLKS